MSDDIAGTCAGCGASVYRQHIDSGIARYKGDDLHCSHCAQDDVEKDEDAYEPIELEEDDDEEVKVDMSHSRIHSAKSATIGLGHSWDDDSFKRPLDSRGIVATRCRTFHCKLSDAAMTFMNDQVNNWLDANEAITVKFATSTIGIVEGKHPEPNLILTVFY